MSEQDKKSGGGSGGSMVMVEKKSASSRHKPYRPTELQEEPAPDLHKRSKAPAVPSVAEELKGSTIGRDPSATVERMECDRAMSSEKHMHIPKKRRSSSPEEFTMVPLDAKKDIIASSPAPIPAQVGSVVSKVSSLEADEKLDAKKKADDDSITEEITELRTPEPAVKEHSEWSDDEEAGGLPRSESRASRVSRAVRQLFCCGVAYHPPSEEEISPRSLRIIPLPEKESLLSQTFTGKRNVTFQQTNSTSIKKKEITWQDDEYLEKIRLEGERATRCQSIFRDLNTKSQAAILERKASIGPCFKPNMLYGGPSGITICVPKKSIRTMKEEFNPIQSVIDFNVSKKAVSISALQAESNDIPRKMSRKTPLKIDSDEQHIKFFSVLRTKLDNMSGRIRNLLNM